MQWLQEDTGGKPTSKQLIPVKATIAFCADRAETMKSTCGLQIMPGSRGLPQPFCVRPAECLRADWCAPKGKLGVGADVRGDSISLQLFDSVSICATPRHYLRCADSFAEMVGDVTGHPVKYTTGGCFARGVSPAVVSPAVLSPAVFRPRCFARGVSPARFRPSFPAHGCFARRRAPLPLGVSMCENVFFGVFVFF